MITERIIVLTDEVDRDIVGATIGRPGRKSYGSAKDIRKRYRILPDER